MLHCELYACVRLVFLCLAERLLPQQLLRRGSNRDKLRVTLFQLWSYLEANDINDIETHITELAEEGITNIQKMNAEKCFYQS